MNILLNQVALGLFLLVNLIVGLRARRGINTMYDYALASKSLGSGVLIATLVATLVDVGNIGLRLAYVKGIVTLLNPFMLSLTGLLMVTFLTRLLAFSKELTLSGVVGAMYGRAARLYTLGVSTLYSMLVIMGQLTFWAHNSDMFGVQDPSIVIVITGMIITGYTTLGGVRSVAKTDVLQALTIIIGIIGFFVLAVTPVGLSAVLGNAYAKSPAHLTLLMRDDIHGHFFRVFFWSIFPTMLISPPVIQRVLMTKKRYRVRSMFLAFAFIYPLLRVLIAIVGLKRFSVTTDITLSSSVSYYIRVLCDSHIGQMLFLLACAAIMMSTMDSFLNAISIMWCSDMSRSLTVANHRQIDLIKQVRMFSLIIGVGCIEGSILFLQKGVEPLDLIGYALMLFSSITFPLLAGLLGIKGSKKLFRSSIITFFVILLGLFMLFQMEVSLIKDLVRSIDQHIFKGSGALGKSYLHILRPIWFLALPLSTLAFLLGHLWEYGAFVLVDREKGVWKEKARYRVSDYFQWYLRPLQWSQGKKSMYGIRHFVVGVVTLIYFLLPFILEGEQAADALFTLSYGTIVMLRMLVIPLCFVIMTREQWSPSLRRYFPLVYYGVVGYAWAFVPMLSILGASQGAATLWHVTAGILGLGMIVDWNTFVLLQLLGGSAALIMHKLAAGVFMPTFGLNGGAPLLAYVLLPLVCIVVFVRHYVNELAVYKRRNQQLQAKKDRQLLTYEDSHDQLAQTLHKNSSMMRIMNRVASELQAAGGHEERVRAMTEVMNHFYNVAQRAQEYLLIDLQPVGLDMLLDNARQALTQKSIALDNVRLYNRARHTQLTCDPQHLATLLANGVEVACTQQPDAMVMVFIDNAWLDYNLDAPYHKEPAPGLRITITTSTAPSEKASYYQPHDAKQRLQTTQPIGLLENQRITHAHYGYMALTQEKTTMGQVYVLPVNLKNIRPKIRLFASEDLANATQVTSKLDNAFLKKAAKHPFNQEQIQRALKVAKHYHRHQQRKSGEPYYEHPLRVANQLLDHTKDEDVIIAALLHDTLEDTEYNSYQLTGMFGENVCRIVQQVTHLYGRDTRPKVKLGKADTLQRLIKEGQRDALLVKLFDRLDNMQTLQAQPLARQYVIAKETRDLFLPIACNLALPKIAKTLEQLVNELLRLARP